MSNRAPGVSHTTPGWKKTLTFLGLSAGILTAAFVASVRAAAVYESPVASLVKLGFKFDGAQSCAAATCHGDKSPKLDSYVKWSGKDKHNDAYNQLGNDKGKKIAAGLSIADATKSDRCLGCHAMNAPANLQGVKFDITEGNSCDVCHGPSEKWREPHSKEGWTEGERKATGTADAMLAKWGLCDTKDLSTRASRCTSCHLAIEPDMIKAGHPTPAFELAYFSDPDVYADRHWKDPAGDKYYIAKEWVVGQAVCARDAMKQVVARASGGADDDAVKDAVNQALSHYTALRDGTGDADVAKALDDVKAAGTDKGKLATAAQAASDTAGKQVDAAAKLSPDKAWATKVMTALAGESMAKDYGLHGVEQQFYGLYELYSNYKTAENGPDLGDQFGKMYDTLDKKTITDDYQKNLDAVKDKLPK